MLILPEGSERVCFIEGYEPADHVWDETLNDTVPSKVVADARHGSIAHTTITRWKMEEKRSAMMQETAPRPKVSSRRNTNSFRHVLPRCGCSSWQAYLFLGGKTRPLIGEAGHFLRLIRGLVNTTWPYFCPVPFSHACGHQPLRHYAPAKSRYLQR